MKNIAITIGILCASLLYIAFSSPDDLDIDERGNIVGAFNHLRETAQGKSFWKDQLKFAESELKWEIDDPERMAQLDREMDGILDETDESMEEFYRDYPDMRPTKAERQVEALRDKADEIEQMELDKELEQMRRERISELRKIIPLIRSKAL